MDAGFGYVGPCGLEVASFDAIRVRLTREDGGSKQGRERVVGGSVGPGSQLAEFMLVLEVLFGWLPSERRLPLTILL